jgi:hypothetical protein
MILNVTAAAAVAGASPATGEPGCRAAVAARAYTLTATSVDGVPQSNCAEATVSDARSAASCGASSCGPR